MTPIEVIPMPEIDEFVDRYVARNTPVVITGLDFDAAAWSPEAVRDSLGDLTALVYGALFDLEDIQSLADYLDDWFGLPGPDDGDDDVPYVRWYNQLRDVEFPWGDEAFARMAPFWRAPACLPTSGLVVPTGSADPVVDPFPYRGVLVAARGARTRLHRDPFASDAVVCQFHGRKEAALYRPERADELLASRDGNSFGGFRDVRASSLSRLDVEPDLHGFVEPGQMIYIPNGWLHDVTVVDDSLSVTWNFVHESGAGAHRRYLADRPEADSEFEILEYFRR